jgi:hypothetical protein
LGPPLRCARHLDLIGHCPTLIKIDVEGYERAMLDGLALLLEREATHTVVVEIDPRNLARYGASEAAVFQKLEE